MYDREKADTVQKEAGMLASVGLSCSNRLCLVTKMFHKGSSDLLNCVSCMSSFPMCSNPTACNVCSYVVCKCWAIFWVLIHPPVNLSFLFVYYKLHLLDSACELLFHGIVLSCFLILITLFYSFMLVLAQMFFQDFVFEHMACADKLKLKQL